MIFIAATFGAPVIEPPGKHAATRSSACLSGRELPFDGAHELMHARERLDVEQLARAHGARHAALAEIVAQEIDDHDVLGAILGARAQLLGERAVAHAGPSRAAACP